MTDKKPENNEISSTDPHENKNDSPQNPPFPGFPSFPPQVTSVMQEMSGFVTHHMQRPQMTEETVRLLIQERTSGDTRQHETMRLHAKLFAGLFALVVLLFFGFLIFCVIEKQTEFLIEVVKYVVLFIGGGGIGYGLGKRSPDFPSNKD